MDDSVWINEFGPGPLVACALHDGDAVRPELQPLLQLPCEQRRYEEDPYTRLLALIAPTCVIGLQSRFEVDLNRPRESAVYRRPEDAWGLNVWREELPPEMVERSLAEYDKFYAHWWKLLEQKVAQNRRVVVFDLHSYNHRRSGPRGPAACAAENPEINLGTRTMNREYWSPVVERWLAEIGSADFMERRLDVRENVRFGGGHLAAWTHRLFPESVCVLAIEVKKFFMDEWTGERDEAQICALHDVLKRAAAGVREELEGFDRG